MLLMSKRNFRPPTLQDKKKWSEIFHDFLKRSLQKDPRKRFSAIKLLKVRLNSGSIIVNSFSFCYRALAFLG